LDHLYLLASVHAISRWRFSALKQACKRREWLSYLLKLSDAVSEDIRQSGSKAKHADAHWFAEQAIGRIKQVNQSVQSFAPWLLPEFVPLKGDPVIDLQESENLALEHVPAFIDGLAIQLRAAASSDSSGNPFYQRLLSLLPDARSRVLLLIEDLRLIADQVGKLADQMDFAFLLDGKRRLLSVGYDVDTGRLNPACYDLLATESRIAVFAAIAKDDIPQETWFLLGRPHALDRGRAVLLSWTGTMFEYLMPTLWMRVYPNTLLERAGIAAVRSQRDYAAEKRIPWGISESAYFRMDESGNYQYHAFGVSRLAECKLDEEAFVVAPYASFLALNVDFKSALQNLRHIQDRRWQGAYGFYEAVDFDRKRRRSWFHRFELVRCWMAHHQGMSLLSIANCLHDDVVQRWFHSHPRVQATELLLQEKPATLIRPVRSGGTRAA